MTEVTFAHLIILRVAELFDIPLSLNNVIASSSGFKNLSPVQIVILGLEKLGMHSVVQESEISKIRPDMLPCLAIMKDGKITIINEMVNDELICTDSEGIKNTIKISDFSSNFGNKLVIINHNNDSIQTSVFSRTQKKKKLAVVNNFPL
jgi:ABC-type bacteriocin/lantibiotic exporter with double-glycine peptidase domain